jgi:hypothetical protein
MVLTTRPANVDLGPPLAVAAAGEVLLLRHARRTLAHSVRGVRRSVPTSAAILFVVPNVQIVLGRRRPVQRRRLRDKFDVRKANGERRRNDCAMSCIGA